MSFQVLLTDDAAQDLEEIYDYIEVNDGTGKADKILNRFEKTLTGLSESPHRGAWPKELLAIGIREFREVFFKPYRIIYRVIDKKVVVMLISDGRRDMQSLLERRLLEG